MDGHLGYFVFVNNVAVNTGVQVFVDLFFVVSEKLTLVEWEEVQRARFGLR